MSTNLITEHHFLYGVTAIVLALTYASHIWGLGRWRTALPFL